MAMRSKRWAHHIDIETTAPFRWAKESVKRMLGMAKSSTLSWMFHPHEIHIGSLIIKVYCFVTYLFTHIKNSKSSALGRQANLLVMIQNVTWSLVTCQKFFILKILKCSFALHMCPANFYLGDNLLRNLCS